MHITRALRPQMLLWDTFKFYIMQKSVAHHSKQRLEVHFQVY